VATDTLPRLSTANELAPEVNLPTWRLYELARNGLIPHVKVGRSVRFSRPAVAEWIRNGGSAGDDAA
jgi:excisionase family DNA binding protein